MTYHVYTAWDADGQPLYVGCTGNLTRRMSEHRKTSPWWKRATVMSAIPSESREEAGQVEYRQIAKLRPQFNIDGNPRYQTVEDAIANRQSHDDFRDLNGGPAGRAAYLARTPAPSAHVRKWIATRDLIEARSA